MRVAKEGYYGGSPAAVRGARVDDVMDILEYERFLDKAEAVAAEINKEN